MPKKRTDNYVITNQRSMSSIPTLSIATSNTRSTSDNSTRSGTLSSSSSNPTSITSGSNANNNRNSNNNNRNSNNNNKNNNNNNNNRKRKNEINRRLENAMSSPIQQGNIRTRIPNMNGNIYNPVAMENPIQNYGSNSQYNNNSQAQSSIITANPPSQPENPALVQPNNINMLPVNPSQTQSSSQDQSSIIYSKPAISTRKSSISSTY